MELTIILTPMFTLFSMALVGFFLRRRKILDHNSNSLITGLTLNVAMPAAILTSVAGAPTAGDASYLAYILLLSVLLFFLYCAISVPVIWFLKPAKGDMGSLVSLAVFPNMGFVGFPILLALYGPQGMFYGVIMNLVSNLFALSVGVKFLAGSEAKMSLRLIFNVSMNASLLAVGLFVLGIQIPPLLYTPLTHMGHMLTPLGMLLLGSILGEVKDVKTLFSGWRIYAVTGIRLLLVPVVTYLVASQFISDPILLGAVLVVSAVPAAIRTAMLSIHYGGNSELISQGIFLSAIFFIATLPGLLFLFGV